jgi:release factor glutamine methyltransferase
MPSLLAEVSARLASSSDTPALDASVLLAHIVARPRSWVMAHPELMLTKEQQEQLNDSLEQLDQGKPFPYVLGHWEFFGMDFDITPDVLIPRPETELLVEKAIAWLQASPVRTTVADIGTGSGAIAVSIAANVPKITILATDISKEALEVAERNAEKHSVQDRVKFMQCDLFPNRQDIDIKSFDLICANLPYIPTETLHGLPIYGREPTLALDGGADGFDLIHRLLHLSSQWLSPGGVMLLEIEARRGRQAVHLVRNYYPEAMIHLHMDLTGQDRLLEIALA